LLGRYRCCSSCSIAKGLQNFTADFDLTLGLSGCASLAEIGGELVEIA
jgi:hypothetical protein